MVNKYVLCPGLVPFLVQELAGGPSPFLFRLHDATTDPPLGEYRTVCLWFDTFPLRPLSLACFPTPVPVSLSLHDMDEDVGMPRPEGLEGDPTPTAGSDGIKLPEVSNLSAERCGHSLCGQVPRFRRAVVWLIQVSSVVYIQPEREIGLRVDRSPMRDLLVDPSSNKPFSPLRFPPPRPPSGF